MLKLFVIMMFCITGMWAESADPSVPPTEQKESTMTILSPVLEGKTGDLVKVKIPESVYAKHELDPATAKLQIVKKGDIDMVKEDAPLLSHDSFRGVLAIMVIVFGAAFIYGLSSFRALSKKIEEKENV